VINESYVALTYLKEGQTGACVETPSRRGANRRGDALCRGANRRGDALRRGANRRGDALCRGANRRGDGQHEGVTRGPGNTASDRH
jgi:hypothetical protein